MKLIIILIKFFFVGTLFIVSNNNLHLGIDSERQAFFDISLSWLHELFDNVKDLTGYVVNSEWLPNASDSSVNSAVDFK